MKAYPANFATILAVYMMFIPFGIKVGWAGKNGELLQLMTDDQFELFVTVDRNLSYQQNLERFKITIVVLMAVDNRREILKLILPKLFEKLAEPQLQKVIEIF